MCGRRERPADAPLINFKSDTMVYSISNDDHETLADDLEKGELRRRLGEMEGEHGLHRLTVTAWDHSQRAPEGGPILVGQVNAEVAARSLDEQVTIRFM